MLCSDVAERVAQVMGISTVRVWLPGKFKQQLVARSLLCHWSKQELGERMTALDKRLEIFAAAVSKAVRRSEKILENQDLKLIN